MDYGQINNLGLQGSSEQPFFTAGAGTISTEVNSFEAENNLDTSNNSALWETTTGSATNTHEIGNRALNSFGMSPVPSEAPMGEVVSLSMPPSVETSSSVQSQESVIVTQEASVLPLTLAEVKTESHLNKAGIYRVENGMNKLKKDGDAAGFYEDMRKLREDNLDASFGRKIAA